MTDIRTSIENGQQQIEEAIAAVEKLTVLLEAARGSRKRGDYAERVKPLVTRIDGGPRARSGTHNILHSRSR